jgi:hypothetical protein
METGMRTVVEVPHDTPEYPFIRAVMAIVADKINAKLEDNGRLFKLYPKTKDGGRPINVLCDTDHILEIDPRGSVTFLDGCGRKYRLTFSWVKTTVEHVLPPCLEEVTRMFGEKAFKNIPFSTRE